MVNMELAVVGTFLPLFTSVHLEVIKRKLLGLGTFFFRSDCKQHCKSSL